MRQHLADREYINIQKFHRGFCKVTVGNVAATGDHRQAVGNQQLVMHTVVDPPQIRRLLQRTPDPAAPFYRVEHAYLHVLVAIQCQYPGIDHAGAEIIHQQAHAHPAIRRLEQQTGEQVADAVVFKDVVLEVERDGRLLDQNGTRNECR